MFEKLGEKIKQLYQASGLTRADLAEAAGIEESQITMIENGEISPSISTLIKISRRLGVRLGTLLDGTEISSPVVTSSGDMNPTINSSKPGTSGHLDFYSLAGKKLDRNMEPFLLNIHSADPDLVKNWSSHEGEEFIYVLEGAVEVRYGKELHKLQAGESIYYDSIVPHCVTTPQEGMTAKVIAVTYTPN